MSILDICFSTFWRTPKKCVIRRPPREEIKLDNAEEAVWSGGNIRQNLEECFNSLDLRLEKEDCVVFPLSNMTAMGV